MSGLLARRALARGARWGVGGDTWGYSTLSAATPASDASATEDGTRTLYVVKERVTQLTQALPGYPVGSTRWRLVAASDADLAVGAIITSGDYTFTIASLDSDQGYLDGILEKQP